MFYTTDYIDFLSNLMKMKGGSGVTSPHRYSFLKAQEETRRKRRGAMSTVTSEEEHWASADLIGKVMMLAKKYERRSRKPNTIGFVSGGRISSVTALQTLARAGYNLGLRAHSAIREMCPMRDDADNCSMLEVQVFSVGQVHIPVSTITKLYAWGRNMGYKPFKLERALEIRPRITQEFLQSKKLSALIIMMSPESGLGEGYHFVVERVSNSQRREMPLFEPVCLLGDFLKDDVGVAWLVS